MNARRIFIIVVTLILIGSVFTGVVNALEVDRKLVTKAALSNVRSYTPAASSAAINYAVDGGQLFAGEPGAWAQIDTPENVIVSAVAVDGQNAHTLYVGAANELAIYRSIDDGKTWQRVLLSDRFVGGVTDIAMDAAQRLVYVGTDTAGLFRLRDVGASIILSGQLLLDQPVIEVVADSTGAGVAYARTPWHLYRAENYGLSWNIVDNLLSTPTALAIANTDPTTVYVGTTDRGLLKSQDGLTWTTANEGLGLVPGSRLQVNALTTDPLQPNVLYVATSYLYGTTQVHESPVGVAMSTDGALAWTQLHMDDSVAMAELLPVSGVTGAVYALTAQSRTPLALGEATVAAEVATVTESAVQSGWTWSLDGSLAWVVAALAALALSFALVSDLRDRKPALVKTLAPRTAPNNR